MDNCKEVLDKILQYTKKKQALSLKLLIRICMNRF